MVSSCLLVTLITCLKGHKSPGFLYNCQQGHKGDGARQTNRQTNRQLNLLSCLGTAEHYQTSYLAHINVRYENDIIDFEEKVKWIEKENLGLHKAGEALIQCH